MKPVIPAHITDQTKVALKRDSIGYKVADVEILNGQAKADLVRDRDPGGAIVLHAIRKNSYVHERMYNGGNGSLDKESFEAAETFRKYFERGGLVGHFAKINMLGVSGGGRNDVAESMMTARKKAIEGLESLGRRKDGSPNFSADVVWHVVGEGSTLEEWTNRVRWVGGNMDKGRAAGILISALERLALHYGLTDVSTIKQRTSERHFGKGVGHAYRWLSVYRSAIPSTAAPIFDKMLRDFEATMDKHLMASTL